MTTKQTRPILDEDTIDAMVIGFASTERGARRIAMAWARRNDIEAIIGLETISSVRLAFNPDLNTREQHRRANAAGRGWVMTVTHPDVVYWG
jgi:hypothetical protein